MIGRERAELEAFLCSLEGDDEEAQTMALAMIEMDRIEQGRTMLHDDITNRFVFHPATPVTGPLHDAVRAKALEYAKWLTSTVPAGRHLSLALTAVQESILWANAGIACDTPPEILPSLHRSPCVDGGHCGGPHCPPAEAPTPPTASA